MLRCKLFELRQARYRAVFIHDLANHSGGIQACDSRNVNARLRLSGTDQHAAALRAQREDVAGTREVLRARLWIDSYQNRGGPIRSRDPGGDSASRID